MALNRLRVPVLAACALLMVGCGGGEDEFYGDICEGRELRPHLSPVSFGEMRPLGNRTPNLQDGTRTPFEWVLLLHSPCREEVTISEVCLVGDSASTAQFAIEGPEGSVASRGNDSAIRITYQRQSVHEEGAQDDVALVIQSNADNAPTLVVPLCARVTDGDFSEDGIECASPVEVPAGQYQDLCS